MPRQRIVIHAGFHKTGTTSVQAVLKQNRHDLWPVMALGLRHKLEPVLSAARAYSVWRDPIRLGKAAYRFGQYVAGLNLSPKRQLLISAEELSGHMAGRENTPDYSAVPDLMQVYAEELDALFGARLQLTFVFTLRDAASWMQSAYWEHVKSSRMVMEFDDFAARYTQVSDLAAVVEQVRAAVPDHQVLTFDLADCADLPLGPASPILDLMRLPPDRRAALKPAPIRNRRGDDALLRTFLDMNRSDLNDETVSARKKEIWAQVRAGGSGVLDGKETG